MFLHKKAGGIFLVDIYTSGSHEPAKYHEAGVSLFSFGDPRGNNFDTGVYIPAPGVIKPIGFEF